MQAGLIIPLRVGSTPTDAFGFSTFEGVLVMTDEKTGTLSFNVGPSVTEGAAECSMGLSYGKMTWDNILECEQIAMDPEVQAAYFAYQNVFAEKAMELGFEVASRHGVPEEKLNRIKAKREDRSKKGPRQ